MGGTIDGARGDHVLLAPPFIITDDEMDLLIERLVEAVDTAIGARR
jgi:adenosylmethionine-8-amino-7-oxononanoate aminotransferase